MSFQDLKLVDPLLASIRDLGYEEPTPIQVQAIPPILEGRDLLGSAHTGTGKTAAFALPILQRLSAQQRNTASRRRPIRALVLTPTRELAAQVGESFNAYGTRTGLKYACVFGGVQQRYQVYAMQKGVDILVATPGRLLDLMGQGIVSLDHVQILVLDEADRMMDMGFMPDVTLIEKACPQERQTLMFSATLAPEICRLASVMLRDPVEVRVAPPKKTLAQVTQELYYVETEQKTDLLVHLLQRPECTKVLVFTKTRVGADNLTSDLWHRKVRANAIHSDKTQSARMGALEAFKNGRIQVLVGTDVASRGLDVDDITHVVNFELPMEDENYLHRIGRTGRAAKEGFAITFCSAEERVKLQSIERTYGKKIPVVAEHPFRSTVPANSHPERRRGGYNRSSRPQRPQGGRPMRPGERPSGPADRRPGRPEGQPYPTSGDRRPGPPERHAGPNDRHAGPADRRSGPADRHPGPGPGDRQAAPERSQAAGERPFGYNAPRKRGEGPYGPKKKHAFGRRKNREE